MAAERDVISRTVIVGSSTLVSRVLGLVREVVNAHLFGASRAFDLFLVAFTVPNLFRRIFGEGAMRDAFMPVFGRETADMAGDPRRLLNVVMTSLAVLLGGITFLGWIGCWGAFRYGGLSDNGRLFCLLLAMMLPYLPLICLSALEGAALNMKGRFFVPAIAPALLNMCWIAGAWLYGERYGVKALAVSVLVAGALQYAVQMPVLWRCRLQLRPAWDLAHKGLRRTVRLMLPVAIGSGVFQVNVLVDRLIAYFCVPDAGAVSVLHYGNRLMQLPLAVLGLALTTAVYPTLVHQAARGDRVGLVRTVNLALRTALFLVLPCMAALLVLRAPIIQLLFESRKFQVESMARTSRVLFYYVLGLWLFCSLHAVTRAFYALEDTRTPMRVGLVMVGANLVLNLILVWPLQEAGLALASSLTAAMNVGALLFFLRRRLGPIGLGAVFLSMLKCGAAAALGGVAGAVAYRYLADLPQLVQGLRSAVLVNGVSLGVGLGVTAAVFLATARLLRCVELREFVDALMRRRANPD